MRGPAMLLLVVLGCGRAPVEALSQHRLRAPFDVAARRAARGCPIAIEVSEIGPPIVDVVGVSYYTDAARSEIDPARKADNEARLAPLRAYYAAVIQLANGYVAANPEDPRLASAALTALVAWADGGALLG